MRITLLLSAGYKTSLIKVDLPEPDTPVMHVNVPSFTSIPTFLRLCSVTPVNFMENPFPLRRFSGSAMRSVPARY